MEVAKLLRLERLCRKCPRKGFRWASDHRLKWQREVLKVGWKPKVY